MPRSAPKPKSVPQPLRRDMWLPEFADELLKLRPYLGLKVAYAIGLQAWVEHKELGPAAAARRYHEAN